MNRAEIIFPSVLFVLVTALLVSGWVLDYSWQVIAFPLGAGAIVCALCVIVVVTRLTGRAMTTAAGNQQPLAPFSFSSVVWIFALGAAVYGLGFVLGPAAYLLTYLRANRFSWLLSVSVAASSLLVTWGLFIKGLHILLPIEPLWWS